MSAAEDAYVTKRCPRSRAGKKQSEHPPHAWVAGVYLPVGDTGYMADCPGWPVQKGDS